MSRTFAAAVALGALALVAQALLARELLICLLDFEPLVGLILAVWLVEAGAGAWAGGRLAASGRAATAAAFGLLLAGATLPFAAALVRQVQGGLGGDGPGGLVPVVMLVAAVELLPAFGAGLGFAGLAAAGEDRGSVSRVYAGEALGALLGGMCWSGWLVDAAPGLMTGLLAAAGACAVASAIWSRQGVRGPAAVAAVGGVLATLLLASGHGRSAEERTTEARWGSEKHLVASRSTRYGDVEIRQATNGARGLSISGVGMYASEASAHHVEEVAHLALGLSKPGARVAIIGAGAGGDLAEVLRHPVEVVYEVEIDPAVVELSRAHLWHERKDPFADPRVRLVHDDGRRFLKRPPEPLDAVIVDFQDPYSAQRARFYSTEFFREARSALAPGGILVMQGFPGEYRRFPGGFRVDRAPGAADLNRVVIKTMRGVFHEVLVVPGTWDYMVASDAPLAPRAAALIATLERRGIRTPRIGEGHWRQILQPARYPGYLADLSGVTPSSDLRPTVLLAELEYWVVEYPALSAYSHLLPLGALALFAVLTLLVARRLGPAAPASVRGHATASLVVFVSGAAGLASQVVLVQAFSAAHGYVLPALGLLFGSYLGGGAFGALLSLKVGSGRAAARALGHCQAGAIVLLLFLPRTAATLPGLETAWQQMSLAAGALALAGAVGGFEFTLAVASLGGRSATRAASGVGRLYAADLAGGALAALLVSAFLLPAWGVSRVAMALAAMKLVALAALLVARRSEAVAAEGLVAAPREANQPI